MCGCPPPQVTLSPSLCSIAAGFASPSTSHSVRGVIQMLPCWSCPRWTHPPSLWKTTCSKLLFQRWRLFSLNPLTPEPLLVGVSWCVMLFPRLQTMSVKLQPASGTQLTAYNPLLPPPAISQVLLLANPQEVSLSWSSSHLVSDHLGGNNWWSPLSLNLPERSAHWRGFSDICLLSLQRSVRLRYKLTLTHGDQLVNETGEIESLPDWVALVGRWTNWSKIFTKVQPKTIH